MDALHSGRSLHSLGNQGDFLNPAVAGRSSLRRALASRQNQDRKDYENATVHRFTSEEELDRKQEAELPVPLGVIYVLENGDLDARFGGRSRASPHPAR